MLNRFKMLKRLAKALAFMCPLKVNLLHCNLTIKKKKKKGGKHMSEFQLDAGFLHDHTVNKHTLKKVCFFFIQSFTVNVKTFCNINNVNI